MLLLIRLSMKLNCLRPDRFYQLEHEIKFFSTSRFLSESVLKKLSKYHKRSFCLLPRFAFVPFGTSRLF